MNDLLPDPVSVVAPAGALGCSASRGFITDVDELLDANGEGEIVLAVDDDQTVRDIEGDCPLAVAVRIDREVTDLRRVHAKLAERVSNAGDVLVGVDTSLGADRADVLARLRTLADRVARLEGGRP